MAAVSSDFKPKERVVGDPIELPQLACGAMAGSKPYVAAAQHNQPLGFPGELVEDWHDKAIFRLGELLDNNRALRVYLDSCVKCGACTDKCHYFLGTGDPKNMPVARQDLLRKVYRRHFTWAGKIVPWLVGAEDLTKEVLDDWYSYFHQCSQCRRCSVFCPYGIDTAEISMAARDIMDTIGLGQKYSNEIIGKVFNIGNNLGLPPKALKNTLESLEEEIEEETGVPVKLPLDVQGADVLLVTPSADFFASPHMEGLIGYAKVLHEAGVNWTFSSHASEAANFACSSARRRICRRSRSASPRLRRTWASSDWCSANAAMPGASPIHSSIRSPARSISWIAIIPCRNISASSPTISCRRASSASTSRRTTSSA